MKSPDMKKRIITGLLAALVISGIAAAEAAAQTPPYVRLKTGQVIEGTGIRAKLDGSITIDKEGVSRTFTADQVAEAVAARPNEYVQAQKLIASGSIDQAIPLLEQITREYRRLGWDIQAQKVLGDALLKNGDAAGAVAAFEKLFRSSPEAETAPDVALGYFEALIANGQYDKVGRKADEFAASGSREHAAKAQIIRGDVKAAQGQLDEALLDYLRTAYYFKKQGEAAAEGFLKAAETLEKLKDNTRARELYQKVVEQYPGSAAAQKARAKI